MIMRIERRKHLLSHPLGSLITTRVLNGFLSIFYPPTQPIDQEAYRLLLIDDHSSHLSYELVSFALQHHIQLLCFPSHTTVRREPISKAYKITQADNLYGRWRLSRKA